MDNGKSPESGVINNNIYPAKQVINNEKSENRKQFDKYAQDVKAIHQLKFRAGAIKATWPWWRSLDDDVRAFVLSAVATQDDWQRWAGCEWGSMPQTLRDAIAVKARKMVRQLGGCPWR